MTSKTKRGKYAAQENYADRMLRKNCVRITVYVHRDHEQKFKALARKTHNLENV